MLRKLEFTIVVLILIAGQTKAQTDSAGVRSKSDTARRQSQPVVVGQESPTLKNDAPFSAENTIVVEPNQVPPELKKTLDESEYRGWESGVLLRNLQTGEYKLELKSKADKVFYFTRTGERKSGP